MTPSKLPSRLALFGLLALGATQMVWAGSTDRAAGAGAAANAAQNSPVAAPPVRLLVKAGVAKGGQTGIQVLVPYGAFDLCLVDANRVTGLLASGRATRVSDTIELAGFDIDTAAPDLSRIPDALRIDTLSGEGVLLVQFIGPVRDGWLDAIRTTGAVPVHYIFNNAYLIRTDDASRQKLSDLPQTASGIHFSIPYQPYFKLAPPLREKIAANPGSTAAERVTLQLLEGDGMAAALQRIRSLRLAVTGGQSSRLGYRTLSVEVPLRDLVPLALLPDVMVIEPQVEPVPLDEVQSQIVAGNLTDLAVSPVATTGPGYLTWLTSMGVSTDPANYPIVDVVDDVIGTGTVATGDPTLHELGNDANPTRMAFANHCTASINSTSGHGHIDASIVGGYDDTLGTPYTDTNGYQRGLGVNPYGRIAGTQIFRNNAFDISNCGSTFEGVVLSSWNGGARITNNSWGDGSAFGITYYSSTSQFYDATVRDADASTAGNQELTTVVAAGNSGPTSGTIYTPGNAKNVITVGGSQNYRPLDSSIAKNAVAMYNNSSRGPAPGSRVKPEVLAPATYIQGTASTNPSYVGPYLPSGQTLFTASTGTSHATPAVSAAASLYSAFLQQQYGQTPTPALLKAYLVAHTTYMTGTGANDTLPSNNQGYGLMNIGEGLRSDLSRILGNQQHLFGASGESWSAEAEVADTAEPLRIVLAYTDQPGQAGTSPQVNDLDLEVTVGGSTYLGNVFNGRWSTAGGTADARNNYEAVFLPAGTSGTISVKVIAKNIAGDGVPGNADTTDQDFALVCVNCRQDYYLAVTPHSAQLCLPTDLPITVDATLDPLLTPPGTAVDLGVTGAPAGTVAVFSDNPVTPTGSSLLTLTLPAGAGGTYTIDVTGSAAGAVPAAQSASFYLTAYNAVPTAPSLLAPADGAALATLWPTLSWSGGGEAAGWTVEIGTDPGLAAPLYSATVNATSHIPTVTLAPETTYYWRVSAANSCGSTASAVYSFTTPIALCNSTIAPIPDSNTSGVTSNLSVVRTGIVKDMNLLIEAAHTWVGDLTFTLDHVGGVTGVNVIDRPGVPATPYGCGVADIAALLDDEASATAEDACNGTPPALADSLVPTSPLAAFDGQSLYGSWNLTAIDSVGGDTGSLLAWCLIPTLARTGDFNLDDCIDRTDFDLLMAVIRAGTTDRSYDLNGDGLWNSGDGRALVNLFDYPYGAACP